jgi:hypothetical protein
VIGGFTVCARGGRVWLHPTGGDGDLEPLEAGELAAALHTAAGRAAEQAAMLDEVNEAARGLDVEELAVERLLERRHYGEDDPW